MKDVLQQLRQLGVTALSLHASQTNPQTAFIAIQGEHTHGMHFVSEAQQLGAPCVILDEQDHCDTALLIIKVGDLKNKLALLAAAFYHYPSEHLSTTAVTGTNGKTSCTQLLAQALEKSHQAAGVIGTLGMGVWPRLQPSFYTTPDAVTLQTFFSHLQQQKISTVFMEASSIALDAHRLDYTRIETAVFTNLTQDHLDYHQTMENYAQAKECLFQFEHLKNSIINISDPFGQLLLAKYAPTTNAWSFAMDPLSEPSTVQHVQVTKVTYHHQGIHAELTTPFGKGSLSTQLIGSFNLENCLVVLCWLLMKGIDLQHALKTIAQLEPIPGRMNVIKKPNKACVIIDYAHTPDALAKALISLRAHTTGELWCVFGCGGDRDKSKRPIMGQIAAQYADHVIITSDNPRNEDPEVIAHEILAGAPDARIIIDRPAAIADALANANPEDTVLIAGKGHETTQEIKGKKYPMCDRSLVIATHASKRSS